MSLLTIIKGKFGELQGAIAQSIFLNSEEYRIINNATIEINNYTTQIDHIIISEYGIFVIEDKNINGLIFGDERSEKWTIVNWKYKYQIQNPLKQNYRHIRTIIDLLGIAIDNVHSVIVFRGNCRFETIVPDNILISGYIRYIKKFNIKCLKKMKLMIFTID